jgi:hypothetical protein
MLLMLFLPHTLLILPVLVYVAFAAGGFGCYITYVDLPMFIAANYFSLLVVGLSSIDLSREYFGSRFNQKPVAIFDIPEPCSTGKALIKFYKE